MNDVGSMVAELIAAGCTPDVAAAVVARAYVAGVNSAEFRGTPVDKVAEKRRAYDRERKRKSSGIPPESTGNESALSISLENKKDKKDRGAAIPEGWRPDQVRWTALSRKLGIEDAEREVKKFISHHRAKGTIFKDWDFAFDKWLLNSADWAPKQPQSSVVQPENINWRQALESFRNFNRWPRGIGSDPESAACRAPPELLKEFGYPTIPQLRAMQ